MSAAIVRRAGTGDVPALLDIYNHYIVHTPASFDLEPRTLTAWNTWFAQFGASGRHQCFVADRDGHAIGWANSARFREKAAYDTTVKVSVYVAPDSRGQGLGRALYETLFAALTRQDVHRAYAGITLPNDASVALHRSFGFEHIGTFHEVGRKFGRYWDTGEFLKSF